MFVFPHFHRFLCRCGQRKGENPVPFPLCGEKPLFSPQPLWTRFFLPANALRRFSTSFFPTAYYYELISLPLLRREKCERRLRHEIHLREGPAAGCHLHRLPGGIPQKLHPRPGGHPSGSGKRSAADRLQPGDRHPHHRPCPDRTGRQLGPWYWAPGSSARSSASCPTTW